MFEIDMEFLRRLGGVRSAVRSLEPGDTAALLAAIDAAIEQADPVSAPLLQLIRVCWTDSAEEDLTSTSRLAATTVASIDCLEQAPVVEDVTTAETLIHQAAGTLLKVAGFEQSVWTEIRSAAKSPEAAAPAAAASDTGELMLPLEVPEQIAEPVVPNEEHPAPDLDELAAQLLVASPEDRDALPEVIEVVESLRDDPWLPEQFRPHVQEAIENLEYAVSGTRRSKKKTAAAEAALGLLGTVIDELMIAVEGARSSRTEQDIVAPVAEVAPEAPSASTDEDDADVPLVADIEHDMLAAFDAEADAPQLTVIEKSTSFELSPGTDSDLLEDFLAEGFDYLEQAEQALLTLENDPTDSEAINVVFRAFHTIKGVSGFLELQPISDLAHHAESLLSSVREGEVVFSPAVADVTLRSADTLRELMAAVRVAKENDTPTVKIPRSFGELVATLSDAEQLDLLAQGIEVTFSTPSAGDDDGAGDEEGGPAAKQSAEGSVRVKTSRLDRLLDLVGELVVAHAMVAEDPVIQTDHQSNLARKVSRSEKILRELQDLATSMRMIPLKPAFQKLSRVVRDVSRRAGKPVQLISEGEDTELDRNMVNVITDPLVHMMRNAIDHGIEPPEERIAAGKPELGEVKLTASQSGGSVIIEIIDDGRGLDREKIAKKAIERGVIESDRGMTDSEVFNLVFAPGFSTADKVTDISGRGVGMDVVKRSVESLRGRIDIRSTPGQGSVFSIHLPLTLAITDGMLIRVGGERYIIPTIKIHMSYRPEEKHLSKVAGRSEMVMLHGELLPLIRLHEIYQVHDASENAADGLVVIVGEGKRRSALLVDELLGQQQFVVKALTGDVAEVPGIAGGTIMGDGSVGLILDPEEIISLWRAAESLGAA